MRALPADPGSASLSSAAADLPAACRFCMQQRRRITGACDGECVLPLERPKWAVGVRFPAPPPARTPQSSDPVAVVPGLETRAIALQGALVADRIGALEDPVLPC